jgi:tetratricopeptide (TPR) repeat protein
MEITYRLVLVIGLSTSLFGQSELPDRESGVIQEACDVASSDASAERARQAVAAGDQKMAGTLFLRAYEACHDRSPVLLEAAEAFTKIRELDEAAAAADEFVRQVPQSKQGLLTLANIYFMAQKFTESAETAERLLEIDPEYVPGLKVKANAVYFLDDSHQAEQILLALIEKHPTDADASYMLGRIYFQENRGDYAMAQFMRVLKLNPRSYKAHDNIALCYEAAGNAEMAIRHFLTAIKLVETDHPEYDWAYANLADLLLNEDDAEKAYNAATMAAKRNPYSARNFYLGGKALMKLGRPEDAQKWLERSTQLDPSYPEPLYVLGQVYMKLGQREKAKATLAQFKEAKANAPRKRK